MNEFIIVLIILYFIISNNNINLDAIHPAAIQNNSYIFEIIVFMFVLYILYGKEESQNSDTITLRKTDIIIFVLIVLFIYRKKSLLDFGSKLKIDTSIIHPASIGV